MVGVASMEACYLMGIADTEACYGRGSSYGGVLLKG